MNKCILCCNLEYKSIYEGSIRSGTWGQETGHSVKVISCKKCGLSRLNEFEDQIEFYQTLEYRKQYNHLEDAQELAEFHDHEQSPRIAKIGIHNKKLGKSSHKWAKIGQNGEKLDTKICPIRFDCKFRKFFFAKKNSFSQKMYYFFIRKDIFKPQG